VHTRRNVAAVALASCGHVGKQGLKDAVAGTLQCLLPPIWRAAMFKPVDVLSRANNKRAMFYGNRKLRLVNATLLM
jgi:hypothetical protein